MTKCWTNPSCDTWWPNLQLMQVTESISGSVVPLAMFAKCLRFLVTNYVLQRTVPGHHIQNWRQIYLLTVKAKRRYFYCILPDRWKEVSAICYFESGLVTQFVRVEEWETNLKMQKSPEPEKNCLFFFLFPPICASNTSLAMKQSVKMQNRGLCISFFWHKI